ncbi:hypothetical protein BANRA_02655 [Escherichia coli]|nr:hypothetical protein BANRA_02655 [Escherichia coli]
MTLIIKIITFSSVVVEINKILISKLLVSRSEVLVFTDSGNRKTFKIILLRSF